MKISKFTRVCMENYSNMTGWQELSFPCKSLKFSTAIAFATFKIYGWKFTGYLILVCSFSFCWQDFSKANCFHVFGKLITWSTNAKGLLRKNGHFQTQFHRPLHCSGTTLFKQNTNVRDFYYFWDSLIQFECARV